MYHDEELLKKIGANNASDEEKTRLLEQFNTLVGEAISEGLSEQQLNEYQAIIDDDGDVIDAWLSHNVSDYKNTALYQEFANAYESDPEKNSPEKLFATIAWIELNVPNRQEIVDKVAAHFVPDAT